MRSTAARRFSLLAATLLATSLLVVTGRASVLGDSPIPTTIDASASEMVVTVSGHWTNIASLQPGWSTPDGSANAANDAFFVNSPFPGTGDGGQPGSSPADLGPVQPASPGGPAPTGSVEAGVGVADSATASPGEGYITTFQQQVPSAMVVILILLFGIAASVVIMMLNRSSAGRQR